MNRRFLNSPRNLRNLLVLSAWGLSWALSNMPTAAQEVTCSQTTGNHPSNSPSNCDGASVSKHKKRGSFIAAPLPISSPALGSGVVPVVGYIFSLPNDTISPPSVLAATGLITNNGSRGFAVRSELYFNENRYRATAAFVQGNINYDLYGLGSGNSQLKLPLNQNGQAFSGEFLRRIGWGIFLGPRILWGSSLITVTTPSVGGVPLPPDLGLHTTLTALGLRLDRDTRPNRFYPTTGTLLDFTADFFSQELGSKYSFQSYEFTFNKYGSLTKNQVLAYNLSGCATGGQPPFYGNCIYGTNNQLRGYIAGRYLDRYMVATQLEYRLALPKRFGVVVFGGLGEVVPGGNQPFRTANFLPAGGGGARFALSKKYHVNLRADFAKGKDSHTWSMGVGEAF